MTDAHGRTAPELDPVIHAPTRLRIVALLAATEEAEFALVRDSVGVSDSVLSKQAAALEAAGYVKVRKGHVGKRPKTWFSLTRQGRAAYAAHVAALQEIVAGSGLTVLPT
jgi:DNA-binding MarR family transcriptional regulator